MPARLPPWPPTPSRPGCWTATSARPGSPPSRPSRDSPRCPANLWEPADGPDGKDFGTHGIFDDQAKNTAPQLWASHHHGLLAGAAAVGAAGAAVLIGGRPRMTAPRSAPAGGPRVWAAATATAGAVTLIRPHAVARLVSGTGSTPAATVVRILGGRQLLQGIAVLIRPTPALVIGGLAVDVLHAVSMVAAAVIWPRLPPGGADQRGGRHYLRRCRVR